MSSSAAPPRLFAKDPASACSAHAFTVAHYDLQWTVDFAARAVWGSCTASVHRLAGAVSGVDRSGALWPHCTGARAGARTRHRS